MAYTIRDRDTNRLLEAGGTATLRVNDNPLRFIIDYYLVNAYAHISIRGTDFLIQGDAAHKLIHHILLNQEEQ